MFFKYEEKEEINKCIDIKKQILMNFTPFIKTKKKKIRKEIHERISTFFNNKDESPIYLIICSLENFETSFKQVLKLKNRKKKVTPFSFSLFL